MKNEYIKRQHKKGILFLTVLQIFFLWGCGMEAEENNVLPEEDSVKEISFGKSYSSIREFPYGEMDYLDDESYALIKAMYDDIDFYGKFETGDLALYDTYIEEYRKLVDGEVPFIIPETGEEVYLKDYKNLFYEYGFLEPEFDVHSYIYFFFDADGDGMPELDIINAIHAIFKYDMASGEIALWAEIDGYLQGSRKSAMEWEDTCYTICEYDMMGKAEMEVYFREEEYWSNGNTTYLIAAPRYADESRQSELPEKVKEQSYFCEEDGWNLFCVTKEQYEELTTDYFMAREVAEDEQFAIAYSYDKLFGTGELCYRCENVEAVGLSDAPLLADGAREVIEYLFHEIYPDQTYMRCIKLYESADELYYRYRFVNKYDGDDGHVSDPTIMYYVDASSDGSYQRYAIYSELWDGTEHRSHYKNSYGNFFIVNTETMEIIPRDIYDRQAEDDASYCTQNEKYMEIMEEYICD